jgi:SRSO17 transposase
VEGLLNDSARKSMQAMHARLMDPAPYQAFQHFVTHAPWDAAAVWRQLLSVLPERRGILIFDDTGFPKQGRHSVGVARQYSGTLGKIGNCQVATTAALWNGKRAWLVGAELYLSEEWLTPEQRKKARIPARVHFREKWRTALVLLRRIRSGKVQIEAVAADAAYGDVTAFRTALEKLGIPYAVGISSTLTVFRGHPRTRPQPPQAKQGRPRTRPVLDGRVRSTSVAILAKHLPAPDWCEVSWKNGDNRPWKAEFVAQRVTPAHDWRFRRLAKEVWLLCERSLGKKSCRKYYFIDLPPEASLSQLVRLAHQRWAIEQQYQELKDELGLDHFEGRTYPGWNHHVVLCALAYAFLQKERMRKRSGPTLTLPAIRAVIQEIFTGLLFAARPGYMEWLAEAKRYLPLRM